MSFYRHTVHMLTPEVRQEFFLDTEATLSVLEFDLPQFLFWQGIRSHHLCCFFSTSSPAIFLGLMTGMRFPNFLFIYRKSTLSSRARPQSSVLFMLAICRRFWLPSVASCGLHVFMFDDERALLVSQHTHVCRKFACLSFATKIRIVTCWIPSELNIGDGPSRGLNCLSGCSNASHLYLIS